MADGLVVKSTGLVFDSAHQPGLAEPSATQLYDYSRYKNHGTFKADGEPDWVRLPSGLWVMDFDGEDDLVSCGSDDSLFSTPEVTLKCWAYPHQADDNGGIMGGSFGRQSLVQRGTSFNFHLIGSGIACSYNIPAANSWYHIVATRDSSGAAKLYINGVLEDTGTSGIATYKPFYIGRGHIHIVAWDLYTFDGLIALPRVYNRALSAPEIGKHFTAEGHWFGK